MAVVIRLARAGTKKRPVYHVVVADSRYPRDGRFIEIVGTYEPILAKSDAKRTQLNVERIQHWLSKGAQPTDRVLRFLDAAGLAKRSPRNNPQKAIPGKKAQERAGAAAPAEGAAPAACWEQRRAVIRTANDRGGRVAFLAFFFGEAKKKVARRGEFPANDTQNIGTPVSKGTSLPCRGENAFHA